MLVARGNSWSSEILAVCIHFRREIQADSKDAFAGGLLALAWMMATSDFTEPASSAARYLGIWKHHETSTIINPRKHEISLLEEPKGDLSPHGVFPVATQGDPAVVAPRHCPVKSSYNLSSMS